MSESTKIWLNNLYENEIKETEGAIQNEEIWAKGAETEEQEAMHMENISSLTEYKDTLSGLMAQNN